MDDLRQRPDSGPDDPDDSSGGPMRILLLTQFFQPEPFYKALPFARALAARGHYVEVLTGFPNYPGGKLYPGYRIRPWSRETMDGIRITRTALYPSHDASSLRRILNYASFALTASLFGPWLIRRPDVIHVYHPPGTVGLPALVLRALRRAPIVYDVHDLWPDTVASTGMMRAGLPMRLLGRWCDHVYRTADRVSVVSPGFRKRLLERGVRPERIEMIPNWAEIGDEGAAESPETLRAEFGLEPGRFRAMFAGTMGAAQALDTLLDAAEIVWRENPNVEFVLLGGGIDRERLEAAAKTRGLANVRFLPRQPMERMAGILALADVLLVHLRDDPLFRITIPSKVQAYFAAGRSVVLAVAGDAADLVEEAQAGWTCPPEDAPAFARAILAAAATPPDELSAMGARGQAYYDREMSVERGVERLEALMRAAVNDRRRRA